MQNSAAIEIESFFSKYPISNYRKGHVLISEQDYISNIFYLKSGYIKQYAISKSGAEPSILNIFKPGSYLPIIYIVNEIPNSFYFEAMTDITVFKAPKEDVLKLINQNTEILYDLLKRVTRGTDGLLKRLSHQMSSNAYDRLLMELITYAIRFHEKTDMIEIDLSEKELAAMSGLTRETVSREIRKLKNIGLLLENSHKLYIKNIVSLEAELNSINM